jgi:hypothetical protein
MLNQGYFNVQRYEQLALVDFKKYDLILHEAGVPPIHTPVSILQALPADVSERE